MYWAMLIKRRLYPFIRYIFLLLLSGILIVVFLKNAPFELPGQVLQYRAQEKLPVIYVVTPTYTRPTQVADLTRLAQTLMHVKKLHWIVVEDAVRYSNQVRDILNRSAIPNTHLLGPRPPQLRQPKYGRGVSNRLRALAWLKVNGSLPGVLYFADDDNTYDIRLFDEIRFTKKVSVFPVGLMAKLGVSTPIVQDGKIVGFHDPYISVRRFAMDMAGFAVNMSLIVNNSKVTMPYKVGMEEDMFLKSLNITINDLEPLAKNCTMVLVWHTKTAHAPFPNKKNVPKKYHFNNTNLPLLYHSVLN